MLTRITLWSVQDTILIVKTKESAKSGKANLLSRCAPCVDSIQATSIPAPMSGSINVLDITGLPFRSRFQQHEVGLGLQAWQTYDV